MKHARSTRSSLMMLTFVFAVVPQAIAAPQAQQFRKHAMQVSPLLKQYCVRCHGPDEQEASMRVDTLDPDLIDGKDGEHWEEVLNQINLGQMPPEDEDQPSLQERALITDWISKQIKHATELSRSSGGRNVIRRLTKYEYNNTMRDLLGLDKDFVKDLPPEGTAMQGFKNNNLVLGTSTLHLEYFQEIAKKALEEAYGPKEKPPESFRLFAEGEESVIANMRAKKPSPRKTAGAWFFGPTQKTSTGLIFERDPNAPADPPLAKKKRLSKAEAKKAKALKLVKDSRPLFVMSFNGLPETGPILVRIRAGAVESETRQHPRIQLMFGKNVTSGVPNAAARIAGEVDVNADVMQPEYYEFVVSADKLILGGNNCQQMSISDINSNKSDKHGSRLFIDSVEIVSPYYPTWPPQTRTAIFVDSPLKADEKAYAHEIIARFMRRAYRRPTTADEVKRMHDLFLTIRPRSKSFESAIIDTLSGVLTAPGFLMLAEPESETETDPQARPLTDYELASRLSYFLWSTMPDETLEKLANKGRLTDPETLRAQVRRMLDDPRSRRFAQHFSSQWLGLENIYSVAVNPEYFPNFKDELKPIMLEETHRFFETLVYENLSCMNLIDSEFAVINAEMAKFYGIPGVSGVDFQKVALVPEYRRGGILTHASVLTSNSNGNDSHPVKRGVWLLERLLGDPPPPPPPSVPTLPEVDPTKSQPLSLNQQLESHRNKAACVNCHSKIDPWGLAFENYSGIGKWRDTNLVTSPPSANQATLKKEKQVASGDLPSRKRVKGKQPPVLVEVDPRTTLHDGTRIQDLEELKSYLLKHKQEQIAENLVRKTLAYALGRYIEFTDAQTVRTIADGFREDDYRMRGLIEAVALSEAFRSK